MKDVLLSSCPRKHGTFVALDATGRVVPLPGLPGHRPTFRRFAKRPGGSRARIWSVSVTSLRTNRATLGMDALGRLANRRSTRKIQVGRRRQDAVTAKRPIAPGKRIGVLCPPGTRPFRGLFLRAAPPPPGFHFSTPRSWRHRGPAAASCQSARHRSDWGQSYARPDEAVRRPSSPNVRCGYRELNE